MPTASSEPPPRSAQELTDLVQAAAPLEPLHTRPVRFVGEAAVTEHDLRIAAEVDVAVLWTARTVDLLRAFAHTPRGSDRGFHASGLRAGVTRAVSDFAIAQGRLPARLEGAARLQATDVMKGCIAAASVRVPGRTPRTGPRASWGRRPAAP